MAQRYSLTKVDVGPAGETGTAKQKYGQKVTQAVEKRSELNRGRRFKRRNRSNGTGIVSKRENCLFWQEHW